MKNRRIFLQKSVLAGAGLSAAGFGLASCRKASSGIMETIHTRRSVRKYTSAPVPEADLVQILNAARMAPTAGNQQPWKFVVIRNRETLNRMKQACMDNAISRYKENKKWTEEEITTQRKKAEQYYTDVFSAPVYVVVLVDMESERHYWNDHDGPLAAGTLMLAARALGYGTVYYTGSIPGHVTKEVLQIPERYKQVCITPVGVPAGWPKTPTKKPLDSFIMYEKIS